MGLARLNVRIARAPIAWGLGALVSLSTPAAAAGGDVRVLVIADLDDDDGDGVADGRQLVVTGLAARDLASAAALVGGEVTPITGADLVRVVAGGRVLPWGKTVPRGASLQGVAPGRAELRVRSGARERTVFVDVMGVGFRDGRRRDVDPARSWASLERTPPERVTLAEPDAAYADPDALRLTLRRPDGAASARLRVESVSGEGIVLDVLEHVPLSAVACPSDAPLGTVCEASAPLRLVVDDVDRVHPLVLGRSLRGDVGGALVVRDAATRKKLQAIRVAGPPSSVAGAIGRHTLTVRPLVVRVTPGGAPAVGGTDAGAIAAVRAELALASATWGQCGLTFGSVATMDVKIVDPPPAHLIAIGDDVALPAAGGEIRLRVEGKVVAVRVRRGFSPLQVALEVGAALERAGFGASVSENARIGPGAGRSADVSVRRRDGRLARVDAVSSSDPTLSVRVGSVDLTDGLQHFGDADAAAGTLEERALVKAFEDGDPATIEIIVIPFFAGGGRIGESFIASDASSMRNVVLLDRAGVRARRTSLTLAHELGHVLLDAPGHPDDFGVDTPTLLMDSDASDSSPFGPRRITVDECVRVLRQSGPRARVPLLTEWKLGPLRLR